MTAPFRQNPDIRGIENSSCDTLFTSWRYMGKSK